MTLAEDLILLCAFTGLSVLAVALRVIARFKTKVGFKADDHWIFAALIFNFAYFGTAAWGNVVANGNTDLTSYTITQLEAWLKYVYVGSTLYCLIITFSKYSVLYLYHRIFGKALLKPLIVIGVLQTIWMIICACMALFRCDPVVASWDPLLQATAKCLDFRLIVLTAEPFNCALDFVMVILPVNSIKKLQLSLYRKILVSTIFVLGGFVGVACILRIVQTERGNVFQSGYWVIIQQNTGIICACLPTLRPVLPTGKSVWHSIRYLKSSLGLKNSTLKGSTEDSGNIASNRYRRYNSLNSDKLDQRYLTPNAAGDWPLDSESGHALNKIKVRTEVEVHDSCGHGPVRV